MAAISGIYEIKNLKNGKMYIGSSVDVEARLGSHRSELRRGVHCNRHLQAAWFKQGPFSFKFSIVEKAERTFLLLREQAWINSHKATQLYNMMPANRRDYKYYLTEEHKKRIGEANRGKKHTHSIEARQKISRAHKGKKHSKEWGLKVGAASAKAYPAFEHRQTGEILPAGNNLRRACEERGLFYALMWYLWKGKIHEAKGWILLGSGYQGKAKPYPAFRNEKTDDVIPAGHNLAALCRDRGFSQSCMDKVKRGVYRNYKGWVLT